MTPAALPQRNLATTLLAEECDIHKEASEAACQRVCSRLGAILSKLAGAAGYRSLLARALALAQAEAPGLKPVRVSPEGTLTGFSTVKTALNEAEFAGAELVLVAYLLELLNTFIGEALTLQLVKEAWPAIDPRSSTDSPTP